MRVDIAKTSSFSHLSIVAHSAMIALLVSLRGYMKTNRNYKASVFSLLFSDPATLRELYSAIENVTLPPNTAIEINTLSNVLYMEQYNDISFTIGNKIVVLIEHQSTINPNMPVRLLLYIARVYEKLIARKKLYAETQILIPTPEFIVLYNGTTPMENDVLTLRLSDCFMQFDGISIPPELELIVKVYNINKGHNEEIVNKCTTLNGYSTFIAKVREYQSEQSMSLEDAMTAAIEYCVAHGILSTFLIENSSEVVNMLLTEWNWDDAKAVWQEEAMQRGIQKGIQTGIQTGIQKGIQTGMQRGIQKGRQQTLSEVVALLKNGYGADDIEKRFQVQLQEA
jgi:predicted transposase/invertase (TIGR01784 family)